MMSVRAITRRHIVCLTVGLAAMLPVGQIQAQGAPESAVPVRVAQVRQEAVKRRLPLSGRIHSRHDASLALTLAGELQWVLEPGSYVQAGDVIAMLDQEPILLRKRELEHMAEQEQVNVRYLDKELARLHQLQKDNNASQRQVDEGESNRDMSRLEIRTLEARIGQVEDELRRSRLVAPYAGIIAERHKRGGEYARPGDEIVRLVGLQSLELRFQVPVVYVGRVSPGDTVEFTAQGGQLMGTVPRAYRAIVRTVIPAADSSSQTVEVRADLDTSAGVAVVAGQLTNVSVQIASADASLQVPRDAIVLRSEGNYVFRINGDNRAHRVRVEVGEGSSDWVSVTGDLSADDWVAIRGVERLQDGQAVSRRES